jgi:hypothetical protein
MIMKDGKVITNNGATAGENVSNSHNLTFHPDNRIQGTKLTKPLTHYKESHEKRLTHFC